MLAKDLPPVAHLLDTAIELGAKERGSASRFLSLVETALKLLREQLTYDVPALEPFAIKPAGNPPQAQACLDINDRRSERAAQTLASSKAARDGPEQQDVLTGLLTDLWAVKRRTTRSRSKN